MHKRRNQHINIELNFIFYISAFIILLVPFAKTDILCWRNLMSDRFRKCLFEIWCETNWNSQNQELVIVSISVRFICLLFFFFSIHKTLFVPNVFDFRSFFFFFFLYFSACLALWTVLRYGYIVKTAKQNVSKMHQPLNNFSLGGKNVTSTD